MKYTYFVLLNIAFLHIGIQVAAQKVNLTDSALGVYYYEIADTFYMEVDSCIRYTNLALPLLKKTKQWEKYVDAITALSYCYNVKGQLDSLVLANEFASDEAEKYLPEGHQIHVGILNNLGVTQRVVYQDFDKSLQLFQSALTLYSQNENLLSYRGNILKNIGEVLVMKGEFGNAKLHFEDALNLYKTVLKDSRYKEYHVSFRVAEMYQNLALVARYLDDFDAAQQYLHQMLQLMKSNARPFASSYYLYCYSELAEVNLKIDEREIAKSYIQDAFALPHLTPDQQAEVYTVQGKWQAAKGEWSAALTSVEKALNLMAPDKAVDFSERQNLRATYFIELEELESALDATAEGISNLSPSLEWKQLKEIPVSEWDVLSPLAGIHLLETRAKVQEQLAVERNQSSYFDDALKTYRYLSDLGDQLRRDYQSQESKLFLSAASNNYYETAIGLAYKLYQQTGKKSYADQALFFFERSKAAVLLEELMAQEAVGRSAIPQEVLAVGQSLKIEINYYRKLIDVEGAREELADQTKIAKWNSELLGLTRERELWEEELRARYPEYQVYIQPSIPSLQTIQQQLKKGEGVLSYFTGRSEWYLLMIRPETIEFKRISEPLSILGFQETVLSNLKLTGAKGIETYSDAAYELYKRLLSEVSLNGLEQLIIIPDGRLAFLPFDLLITNDLVSNDARSLSFLFKEMSISYAYSWAVQNINTTKHFEGSFLHIAPVFTDDQSKYLPLSTNPLPESGPWRPVNLTEAEATTTNFMEIGQNYSILHFASHASAYDSVFQEPSIDFIDTSLYLRDLQSMRLSANLVVLSACDAGVGDLQRGEGIMSLARGFAYAGVPSVISTLWKVNERTTHQLLDRFYYHLAKGESKDQALRQAKLDFIDQCSDIEAAPYYWAGIVAIGDMQPIQPARLWKEYSRVILVGVVLFGIVGSFLLFSKNRV